LSVDPKAHWYPSHSPYNFSLNNPINLVDPNGQWVEGAGFFNNLFNSDRYVLAKEAAAKHTNSTITKRENGSYRVSYTTKSHENDGGGEHIHMDELHMEEFKKCGNKNRTDKTFMHTTDRQFDSFLGRTFRSGSTWVSKAGEWCDRNLAPRIAKTAVVYTPATLIPSAFTMLPGEDFEGNIKEGARDRYIFPAIDILAASAPIRVKNLPKEKDLRAVSDMIDKVLDAKETYDTWTK